MKIHTVFISYKRLELTKQALFSYRETVSMPHSVMVVDNSSDYETVRWLRNSGLEVLYLGQNFYPGYATNRGWELAPYDATHLHRADNDFIFLPGWCEEVERRFLKTSALGQLGLRTDEEELSNAHNVGGNCIIRKELWEDGLRWDERPWPKIKTVGYTEDSFMSPKVAQMGWLWGRVRKPCIQPISFEDPDDPYYIQTWADRGIVR